MSETCRHGLYTHRVCEICAEVIPLEQQNTKLQQEVAMLRSALKAVYDSEEEMENDDGFLSHEISAGAMCKVNKALDSTSDSEKWMREHDAEVLENAIVELDTHVRDCSCFRVLDDMANELRGE